MLIFFFISKSNWSDFYEVMINKLPINFEVGWSLCPPWYTVVADAREGSATCYCTPTAVIYVVCSLSPTLPPTSSVKAETYVGTEEGFLGWDCGGDTNGANQQITDERWSQWVAGVPEPTSLSCKVAVHTYLACSESWVCTRMYSHGGRQLSGTGSPQSGALPSHHRGPLARPGLERGHILQGMSKQKWHVDVLARDAALGSLPPHLMLLPEKQPWLFSFPLFSLLFFFSLPVKCNPVPEKTESVFVLMVVPFLRFILT